MARFSIALESDVPGGLPGEFARERLRVLEDRARPGRPGRPPRRELTLQFAGAAPGTGELVLAPGWRREPMSLEDVFIASVASRADAGAARR